MNTILAGIVRKEISEATQITNAELERLVASIVKEIPTLIATAHLRGENSVAVCTVHEVPNEHTQPLAFSRQNWSNYFRRKPRTEWLNTAARKVFDYCVACGLEPVLTRYHIETGNLYSMDFWKATKITVRWKTEYFAPTNAAISKSLTDAA